MGPQPRGSARPAAWVAGVSGCVSVGLALAVTELLAGLVPAAPSALASVGAVVVDNVPAAIEDAAIGIFGTADKAALAIGTVLIALLVGWLLGRRALDRPPVAVRGFLAFGLLGVVAVVADPLGDPVLGTLGVVAGVATGLAVLRWLLGLAVRAAAPPAPADHHDDGALVDGAASDAGRRRLVVALLGVAGAALVLGAAGRLALHARGRIEAPDLVLSEPAIGAPPVTPAHAFTVEGLTPVVVPREEFYRIDTALIVPRVDPGTWQLRVHGLVDRERTFTLDQLYAREQVERHVTLACVSNEVGDELVGNARWQGVRLGDVLEEAGVQAGAGQVVGRAVDGWTAGFPTELVFDGREPLIALAMNGAPLPADHGFPARLIVPGLYGYVSATKWLSDIELTTWDGFDAYWVPRGWAKRGPIKLQSRIDVPREGARVEPGEVVVAGVAWSGLEGIRSVEVAVDDGPWSAAELTDPLSDAAWVQWRRTVTLSPGRHRIEVRATDASGRVQTDELAPPRPDGATGHHAIVVQAGRATP